MVGVGSGVFVGGGGSVLVLVGCGVSDGCRVEVGRGDGVGVRVGVSSAVGRVGMGVEVNHKVTEGNTRIVGLIFGRGVELGTGVSVAVGVAPPPGGARVGEGNCGLVGRTPGPVGCGEGSGPGPGSGGFDELSFGSWVGVRVPKGLETRLVAVEVSVGGPAVQLGVAVGDVVGVAGASLQIPGPMTPLL